MAFQQAVGVTAMEVNSMLVALCVIHCDSVVLVHFYVIVVDQLMPLGHQ